MAPLKIVTIVDPAIDRKVDWVFFVVGGAGAVWLAFRLVSESFSFGWWQIAAVVLFWVFLAYLLLPRLHRILTRIYVPDYFIGRARTSDGLLGDPVNIAMLGNEPQLHTMMQTAGWIRADDLSAATAWRIIVATLTRRSYREAPVSPLLLFGRTQDFAYQQEVNGTPGRRHHVRFWRCPEGWRLPGGHQVDWLAAGTYDRSVGFSLFTLQVTHKIEARTDIERDFVVASVQQSNPMAAVEIIEHFSTGYHARNGGGDSIQTDGSLPIVDGRAIQTKDAAVIASSDSRDRRPSATVVGSFLLVLRAVAALIVAGGLYAGTVHVDDRLRVAGTILWAIYGVVGLLLAVGVLRGRNSARVVGMVLAAVSVIIQVSGGGLFSETASLPGLAIDVLLLMALSSERALVFARRRPTRES